jgi:hypothetical protein
LEAICRFHLYIPEEEDDEEEEEEDKGRQQQFIQMFM